jgi:hypothetical protein
MSEEAYAIKHLEKVLVEEYREWQGEGPAKIELVKTTRTGRALILWIRFADVSHVIGRRAEEGEDEERMTAMLHTKSGESYEVEGSAELVNHMLAVGAG